MFIVATTIAIIAAMGVYALTIAANEVKTSGYLRQSVQTHYLSEYGVLGAAQEVTGSKAAYYYNLAVNSPDTICPSLPGIVPVPGNSRTACRRVGSAELASSWPLIAPAPPITPWTSNATELLRGSMGLNTNPDFYVEFTDPITTHAANSCTAGTTPGSVCCFEFTVTAVGLTQGPLVWIGAGNKYASEGLETARVRLIGGPAPCPTGH